MPPKSTPRTGTTPGWFHTNRPAPSSSSGSHRLHLTESSDPGEHSLIPLSELYDPEIAEIAENFESEMENEIQEDFVTDVSSGTEVRPKDLGYH